MNGGAISDIDGLKNHSRHTGLGRLTLSEIGRMSMIASSTGSTAASDAFTQSKRLVVLMRACFSEFDVTPSFPPAGIRAGRLFALLPNLGPLGSGVFRLSQIR